MDQGQWATLAYIMTGEDKYVDKAVAKILPIITKDPPNANFIREWMIDFALFYKWLSSSLTVEENTTYRNGLNRWCEWANAVNTKLYVGGWRPADTDQTTGQFFGVAIADGCLNAGWSSRESFLTVREAIRRYAEWSADGEWMESESYNLGTVKLLLSGAYGAGIEKFPEVAAVVPKLARQQLANLTPDYKEVYKWGDEEKPGDLMLYKRVPLLAMLAGITNDETVHRTIDILTEGLNPREYLFLGWRALYLYRPSVVQTTSGYLHFGGNGHLRYKRAGILKRDGVLFGCHFPNRLGVDHEVNAMGDFRLYIDDEWVINHPLGYGGKMVEGEGCNSALLSGLSSMINRGLTGYAETEGGFWVEGRTYGQYYPQPYWDSPPPFADWLRRLTYTYPGRVEVKDSFNGNLPTRIDRYRAADQARMNGSQLWQQVFHCPKLPMATEGGFEWTTAKGRKIRITAPIDSNVEREVLAEESVLGTGPPTYIKDTELTGYQIRFCSNDPVCEMKTVIEVL
jgi:hypothetical protein